jgi:hypothetical protein
VIAAALQPAVAPCWPPSWRDAEVVDAVLVEEAGPLGPASRDDAGLYDASGRPQDAGRFGRLVSVLA